MTDKLEPMTQAEAGALERGELPGDNGRAALVIELAEEVEVALAGILMEPTARRAALLVAERIVSWVEAEL